MLSDCVRESVGVTSANKPIFENPSSTICLARFMLYSTQAESLVPMEDTMKTDGNEPAFARPGDEQWLGAVGLTKREYFAAIILQGMCAQGGTHIHRTPQAAVSMADSLIDALNK